MKKYQSYCFDLDGTVYHGKEVIPEAKAAIKRLREKGLKPFYVTNNAKMTQQQIYDKLSGMGIELELDHIMTSAIATAKYIANHYPQKTVYMLGEDGLREALLAEGIKIVDNHADIVVQGIDFHITYEKMEEACYQLQHEAIFIATNSDIKVPRERGFAPGNGSLVNLISGVTNKKPLFIGKPEQHLLQIIQQNFNLEKEEMIMIGDNYDTDILAGVNFGIDTLHVNTGVTPTDEMKLKPRPATYSMQSLDELI